MLCTVSLEPENVEVLSTSGARQEPVDDVDSNAGIKQSQKNYNDSCENLRRGFRKECSFYLKFYSFKALLQSKSCLDGRIFLLSSLNKLRLENTLSLAFNHVF